MKIILFVLVIILISGCGVKSYSNDEKVIDSTFNLPSQYDMKSDGLITSVKYQKPWGTCWAFGDVSAIESSIISDYKKGDISLNRIPDVSEKYFISKSTEPVSEDISDSQSGEGIYYIQNKDKKNNNYMSSGSSTLIPTYLASGGDLQTEENIPYEGRGGLTEYEWYSQDLKIIFPELKKEIENNIDMSISDYIKSANILSYKRNFTLCDNNKNILYNSHVDIEGIIIIYKKFMKKYYSEHDCYSKHDDWDSIVLGKRKNNLSNITIKNINYLPEPIIYNILGEWESINYEGVCEIKKEILNGHAVGIGYKADKLDSTDISSSKYMNTTTWSHYTFDNTYPTHYVCIVGWDDSYSRRNFKKEHMPPGDGAWLVKNSYGSEVDYLYSNTGRKIGDEKWGICDTDGNHTGYFYLSYYDKSISSPKTYEFYHEVNKDKSEILQYDFMPSLNNIEPLKSQDKVKISNIFTVPYNDSKVSSLLVKTNDTYSNINYKIYLLGNHSCNPEDGELICEGVRTFIYPGYHRFDITIKDFLKKGQRFSVVITETNIANGDKYYLYGVNNGYDWEWANQIGADFYVKGIINKGESFLYSQGEWKDWATSNWSTNPNSIPNNHIVLDNFSIKAYIEH